MFEFLIKERKLSEFYKCLLSLLKKSKDSFLESPGLHSHSLPPAKRRGEFIGFLMQGKGLDTERVAPKNQDLCFF